MLIDCKLDREVVGVGGNGEESQGLNRNDMGPLVPPVELRLKIIIKFYI